MQKRKSSQGTSLYAPTFRTSCPRVKGSLQGIDGNAFMLMGYFQKLAQQQGFSKEWIQEVLDEARSSGYDHLVATLLDHMEE